MSLRNLFSVLERSGQGSKYFVSIPTDGTSLLHLYFGLYTLRDSVVDDIPPRASRRDWCQVRLEHLFSLYPSRESLQPVPVSAGSMLTFRAS